MVIPEAGAALWHELSEALASAGRVGCESSAMPEAWWTKGLEETAVGVCRACPVRAECLQYALAADERFGVWGGLSETERAGLRA